MAVWGALVYTSETGAETTVPFHFHLQTRQLTLTRPTGDEFLQLDEMGIATPP